MIEERIQVSLQNIEKSFGNQKVIDGISLDVRQGEFLTLLGPSGCGKTTLLRMINGFEKPDSGSVLIDGEDQVSVPPNKRNVNTVFQSYALFPHLTVRENVEFSLKMKKVPEEKIVEKVNAVLEMTNLEAFANRKPSKLSGGQQQRVAIARSLVCEPKVLLLDEPLGALDLKLRKQMQMELKDMQKASGITYIYVTHDQEEALTISDRIVVLNGGHIEQIGEGNDIYLHPSSRFVASFLGESNFFSGDTENLSDGRVVSLRPEFLILKKDRPEGIAIPARITKVTYLGVYQRIELVEQNGLKAVALDSVDSEWHVGDNVFMTWDPDNSQVIQEEGDMVS